MDSDLERSVRLLDDALSTPTKGLFKLSSSKIREKIDLSLTVQPEELQKLLDITTNKSRLTNTIIDTTVATGDVIQSGEYPWERTLNNLYNEFSLIMQNAINGSDILEIIADLGRCCTDALTVINGLKSKIAISELPDEKWLENERNNWRLLFILYQDRLEQQQQQDELSELNQYKGNSEKLCIDSLFKRDHLVRESQLVIDWLERNALDRDDPILHHSDWTYGWENTLHQILSPDNIAIGSNTKIVSTIYPDVRLAQSLPLHHLDEENEKKLCQRIFTEIRCGKLQAAQELCYNCGHPWRAVLLEGWKLYHNPNLEEATNSEDSDDKMKVDEEGKLVGYKDVEGNRRRDLWKIMAIESCKKKNMDVYETAAIGTLCGHLESILSVCESWEDYLWAFMRTMIDIRVESEIRDCIVRNYKQLPEDYWEQKMSLNEIFKYLESSDNDRVRCESQQSEHIVQKLIILDEIPKLIDSLSNWIQDTNITTQSLRFYTHLVLFFDHIGQIDRSSSEKIIETYIERLSEMNETQLVAFYASKLNKKKQITIYANHLERILDNEERRLALSYGEDYGLDVLAITKRIVECTRNRPIDPEINITKKLTDDDRVRVSALDWLIFYEEQRAELLSQTNLMIFIFLTLNKLEAADLAIKKVPADTIKYLTTNNELNNGINQIIKEYLSFKTYLDAHESFNEWFKQYHNRPIEPNKLTDNVQFLDKVVHEHKLSQYNAELQRWKLLTNQSAKRTQTLLYNVLLFPEGWLIGAKDADYLRRICIPEIVLLLYSVLSESGNYTECVQLADLIASDKYNLYKVYTKEKLTEILEKICESSVILLKDEKDPFGASTSK